MDLLKEFLPIFLFAFISIGIIAYVFSYKDIPDYAKSSDYLKELKEKNGDKRNDT